jgi:hypothetical protein
MMIWQFYNEYKLQITNSSQGAYCSLGRKIQKLSRDILCSSIRFFLTLIVVTYRLFLLCYALRSSQHENIFTALASEERGNVIARVCMSLCPSVCVLQNVQRIYIFAPHRRVIRIVALDVTIVRDDSNLLYTDISRGDELNHN